jgi:hypothetical protein
MYSLSPDVSFQEVFVTSRLHGVPIRTNKIIAPTLQHTNLVIDIKIH